MTETPQQRTSPLHTVNADLGGRFVDFAGWSMPVQFEGTLAEHAAVRESVGVFDVSHLGRFSARGPGITAVLERLLCNDLNRISPGRAQYTMMLTPDGGVVDDIIVWRWDEDDYWVLPNGANHSDVIDAVRREATSAMEIDDVRPRTAMVAVQGPEAPDLLERVFGWRPRRFRVDTFDHAGISIHAAGTGYTGEAGGELAIPAESSPSVLRELLAAGAKACGLGARDTLRLEMGYSLWGQDLDRTITPLEAGLEWVVGDGDFVGSEALAAQRRDGLTKRMIAFRLLERGVPRHGYRLRCGDSEGLVASGNHSPTLGYGIGMGYVSPDPGPDGGEVAVEIRGRWVPADRVNPPFLER